MTPSELYAKPVIESGKYRAESVIRRVLTNVDFFDVDYEKLDAQTRLAVKVHGYYDCQDGRRYAILASVWFDGRPFAIVQSGGREGDDHVLVIVTSHNVLCAVERFFAEKLIRTDNRDNDVPEDEDIPNLCKFYNCDFAEQWT
jgi:hypothetical protein